LINGFFATRISGVGVFLRCPENIQFVSASDPENLKIVLKLQLRRRGFSYTRIIQGSKEKGGGGVRSEKNID